MFFFFINNSSNCFFQYFIALLTLFKIGSYRCGSIICLITNLLCCLYASTCYHWANIATGKQVILEEIYIFLRKKITVLRLHNSLVIFSSAFYSIVADAKSVYPNVVVS